MERKSVIGLPFIYLDCDFLNNPKLEAAEKYLADREFEPQHKPLIHLIAIKLLCCIGENGYCIILDQRLISKLREGLKSSGVTVDIIYQILESFIHAELIDREMYEMHNILTSTEIQMRWKQTIGYMRRTGAIQKKYDLTKTIDPMLRRIILPKTNSSITVPESTTAATVYETGENGYQSRKMAVNIQQTGTMRNDADAQQNSSTTALEYPIKECMEIYLTDNRFSKSREDISIIFKFPPSLPLLAEWCQAFTDFQIMSLKKTKTLQDFANHFYRWLNLVDTTKDPKTINNPENLKGRVSNGK